MAVRSLSVGLPVRGMKLAEASAKRAVIASGFILDDGMGRWAGVKYVVTGVTWHGLSGVAGSVACVLACREMAAPSS